MGIKIGKTQNLRGGYNMRIWRPGIWNLNPYFDDRNPMFISQGNSNLESEKSHSFNLSYSMFSMKFNGQYLSAPLIRKQRVSNGSAV